jgi:hypothetical protein
MCRGEGKKTVHREPHCCEHGNGYQKKGLQNELPRSTLRGSSFCFMGRPRLSLVRSHQPVGLIQGGSQP